jgi:hypothetical protein
MADTAIVGENVEVIQTRGPTTAFSWSVVIAGALAAWAVAFIFISLGTGLAPSGWSFQKRLPLRLADIWQRVCESAITSPVPKPNFAMQRTASWFGLSVWA